MIKLPRTEFIVMKYIWQRYKIGEKVPSKDIISNIAKENKWTNGTVGKLFSRLVKKGFLREDILLISSDGLTNMVKQEDIFRIAKGNIEKAPIKLVDLANENGGLDNITVVVLKNI